MSKSSNKTTPYSIRLTAEERQFLEEMAGGIAVSTYIKSILFKEDGNTKPKPRVRQPVKDDKKLAELLACLGNSRLNENLRTLAEAAEHGTLYVDEQVHSQIQCAVADVHAIRMMLMKALGFHVPPNPFVQESMARIFTREGAKKNMRSPS